MIPRPLSGGEIHLGVVDVFDCSGAGIFQAPDSMLSKSI